MNSTCLCSQPRSRSPLRSLIGVQLVIEHPRDAFSCSAARRSALNPLQARCCASRQSLSRKPAYAAVRVWTASEEAPRRGVPG